MRIIPWPEKTSRSSWSWSRSTSSILVLLFLAFGAHAQLPLETGDVLVYSFAPVFCTCTASASQFAVFDATGRLKASPNLWATGVLAPSPDLVLMSQQWHLAVNDAKMLAGRGLDNLGEIVETRAGQFFVAETSSSQDRAALLQFTRFGEVLGVMRLPSNRAAHIELLSDQCTLLYTSGWVANPIESRRVRRYNVCTEREEADLFSVPVGAMMAGAIRELPEGDLLIATGMDVRRFSASGQQLAVYRFPATHIALTPDASGFWAAWGRTLQRVDFEVPGNVAVSITLQENYTGAFAVVGEWRSAAKSTAPIRRRRVR